MKGSKDAVRVMKTAVALVGVVIVEAVANVLSRNFLCALLSLFVLVLPLCGIIGARRRSRALVNVFWCCNAVCGVCYIVGLAVVVGVFIPTMRCLCDPDCAPTFGLGGGVDDTASWLSGGGSPSHAHIDPEDEASWGTPLPGLMNEETADMARLCGDVSLASLYCSVLLSALAALVHFVSCYAGKKLVDSPVMVTPCFTAPQLAAFGAAYPQTTSGPGGVGTISAVRGRFGHAMPVGNPFVARGAAGGRHRLVGFGNSAAADATAPAPAATGSSVLGRLVATVTGGLVGGTAATPTPRDAEAVSPTPVPIAADLPLATAASDYGVSSSAASSVFTSDDEDDDPFEELDDHSVVASSAHSSAGLFASMFATSSASSMQLPFQNPHTL